MMDETFDSYGHAVEPVEYSDAVRAVMQRHPSGAVYLVDQPQPYAVTGVHGNWVDLRQWQESPSAPATRVHISNLEGS